MPSLTSTISYIRYCYNPEPSESAPIGPILVAGIVTTVAIFAAAVIAGIIGAIV